MFLKVSLAVKLFLTQTLTWSYIYDAPMMIKDDISANKRSFRSSSMHKTAAAVAEQIRADILQQFQA
jgi:hypothetical protein